MRATLVQRHVAYGSPIAATNDQSLVRTRCNLLDRKSATSLLLYSSRVSRASAIAINTLKEGTTMLKFTPISVSTATLCAIALAGCASAQEPRITTEGPSSPFVWEVLGATPSIRFGADRTAQAPASTTSTPNLAAKKTGADPKHEQPTPTGKHTGAPCESVTQVSR
jgi:hypothetical protein